MVKAYGQDLRWRVIFHRFIHGWTVRKISQTLLVSVGFVVKIRHKYLETGFVRVKARLATRKLSCKYLIATHKH